RGKHHRAAGPVLFWPVLVFAALKWRRRARFAGPDRQAYLTLFRMAVSDAVTGRLDRDIAEIRAIAGASARG
ncbi:MAG: hypothetical protein B7Y02_07915, partial [Rhodobacterales bacterium 17-64-5]